MTYLILIVLAIVAFLLYRKFKTKNNASAQRNASTQNKISGQGNTTGESIASAPSASFAPFQNEAEKQHYEMIYGLLASSNKRRDESEVKRFINFHTNLNVGLYAFEKFFDHSALSWGLFKNNSELTEKLKLKGISTENINKIIELNKHLRKTLAYRYSLKDANAICRGKATKDSVTLLSIEANDEIVKHYYAIVYALLDSIKPNGMAFEGIKEYIETLTKQDCDAKKLYSTLAFFYEAYEDNGFDALSELLEDEADTLDELQENESNYSQYFLEKETNIKKDYELLGLTLEDINSYRCSKQEACKISYPGIIEEIKADCKEIFNIAFSYGVEHFDKGWNRKDEEFKYQKKIGYERTTELFRQSVQELFFEGDDAVTNTLCNRMAYHSHCARNKWYVRRGGVHSIDKALPTMAEHAAAVTIRALHFEKYGQNREGYKAITENDCREFVSNSEAFKRIIEQQMSGDPFSPSVKNWSNNLVNAKFAIFDWIKKEDGGDYLPSDSEYYYADALCNALWKWVAEDYENGDSTDPDRVFEILLDYFKPDQNTLDELQAIDERRATLREQCRSCALYENCDSKRENCSAWVPKQR